MENKTIDSSWKPDIQPLTPTQVGIIRIIKSAVRQTKEVLPEGFDWREAAVIIRRHRIETLIYYGLKNMSLKVPSWIRTTFLQKVSFLTRLWNEAEKVMAAFDEAEIEYIPLKGICTKDLYPARYMRSMNDVDILIHVPEYAEKIRPVMIALGWTEGVESDHELHWTKDGLMIELHKKIIPKDQVDFCRIVGDGWDWMQAHSQFEYSLVHFAKHYRDSGFGISHLVELEVCWEDADFSELGLNDFKDNIRKTLDFWFYGKEADEKVRLINSEIFTNGEYGRSENRSASADLRSLAAADGNTFKATIEQYLYMVFLDWPAWRSMFPVLEKWPVLFPLCFMWRIIRTPFRKSGRKNMVKTVKKQEEYAKKLAYIGLKYGK